MKNTTPTEANLSAMERNKFQADVNGKQTDLFILKNPLGMEVAVTNFGGAIVSIMVPDKKGQYANVVLSNDSIESTINSPEPFLNTLVGRYANRIGNSKFTLFSQEYNLSKTNDTYTLHGGPKGFHTRVWDAEQSDEATLYLRYRSVDGEEGFPGNLDIEVCYHLDNQSNAIDITYSAHTDKPTVVNLTSHGFFNLAGTGNPTPTVLNNVVTINADHFLPIDENSIPTGEILKVEGTPMDFRTPHIVGERINDNFEQLKNGTGYDHCYILNKVEAGELSLAAICTEPVSGRSMEVYTTEPGIQLYTGNWLNGFSGAYGATFPARSAICFEAQCFPDTPNKPYFPSAVLMPGEEYYQHTIYKFGIIE